MRNSRRRKPSKTWNREIAKILKKTDENHGRKYTSWQEIKNNRKTSRSQKDTYTLTPKGIKKTDCDK